MVLICYDLEVDYPLWIDGFFLHTFDYIIFGDILKINVIQSLSIRTTLSLRLVELGARVPELWIINDSTLEWLFCSQVAQLRKSVSANHLLIIEVDCDIIKILIF